MRKIILDAAEKKIMDAIEKDEFVAVTGRELYALADAIAARRKDATLTIRVNSHDIEKIKKLAKTKDIPYQSYLSEIIHKVAVSL